MTLGIVIVTGGTREQMLIDAHESAQVVADDVLVVNNTFRLPGNHGIGAALNHGIHRLKTDWIMRLDDDNLLIHEAATDLKRRLPEIVGYDVVTAPCVLIDSHARYTGMFGRALNPDTFEVENHIQAGCWFRRALWDAIGGFEEHDFEDWRFWIQAKRLGCAFMHQEEPYYMHRVWEDNLGSKFSPTELSKLGELVRR